MLIEQLRKHTINITPPSTSTFIDVPAHGLAIATTQKPILPNLEDYALVHQITMGIRLDHVLGDHIHLLSPLQYPTLRR